jgi:hypothetical protein
MELAFGTILVTLFLGVVIYTLLAFVTGKSGCCGHTQDQGGAGRDGSCCGDLKK